MTDENVNYVKSLALRLAGDAISETDEQGRPITDDTLLILGNAHHEPLTLTLPAHERGVRWHPVFDTARKLNAKYQLLVWKGGEQYTVEGRALAVLKLTKQ